MVIYSKSAEALNLPPLNTTTYMVKALFIFLPLLKIFIWKYCPNEIQDKHTKNVQEKVISLKDHCMSFISDNFVSNTGWKLIKILTISGIIICIRKTSTTALNHQYLKVKDIEWDISQSKDTTDLRVLWS